MSPLTTAIALGVLLAALLATFLEMLRRYQVRGRAASAEETARRIVEEARKEGEAVRKQAQTQAKEVVVQARTEFEREVREERRELQARDGELGRPDAIALTVEAASRSGLSPHESRRTALSAMRKIGI